MSRFIILIIILTIILASCTVNPRDTAALVREQSLAASRAADAAAETLDRETQRQHQEALNAIAEGEAVIRQAAITEAMTLFSYALAAALAVIALGAAVAASILAVGRSLTRSVRDTVAAMTIRVDPETGEAPLLLVPSQVARFHLANPNTDSVMLLGDSHEANPRLVLANHHVKATAVLAHQARLAKGDNAAYIGSIRPPMMMEDKDGED